MNSPTISVIMAVYNAEPYLHESIQSILTQTFDNFEFFIVDDCSTDASRKIITDYAQKDARIKLLFNKERSYPAKTRNFALQQSKGKYIAILDADDAALPERLERQIEYLENNLDIFLLGTEATFLNSSGNVLKKSKPPRDSLTIEKTLPLRNCILHSTVMYRNEEGIRYREKLIFSHDYDLFLLLLSKKKKMMNLDKVLVKRRLAPNSVGETKTIKQALFMEKAREFYQQRVRYGHDHYDSFSPTSIMDMDETALSRDPRLLKIMIYDALKKRKKPELNSYSRKYLADQGYFNRYLFFYLFSYLPRSFINVPVETERLIKTKCTFFHKITKELFRR